MLFYGLSEGKEMALIFYLTDSATFWGLMLKEAGTCRKKAYPLTCISIYHQKKEVKLVMLPPGRTW